MELQDIFNDKNLDYIIIKSGDKFLSEIVPLSRNILLKYTRFSGSNGIAILKKSGESFLFTDSRYKIQAKNECPNFEILDICDFYNFLKNINGLIGFDANFHKADDIHKMIESCKNLQFTEIELEDENQEYISNNILKIETEICGESTESRIEKIRKYLTNNNLDAVFISNPEDTSWIFNVRDMDNKFSYIYNSYSFISLNDFKILDNLNVHKFIDLIDENLNIVSFGDINFNNYKALKNRFKNLKIQENFIEKMRMRKSSIEIKGIKGAQKFDSVALSKFLSNKQSFIGRAEYEIAQEITNIRAKNPEFKGESFSTICGFNENGAIVHYRPEKDKSKTITENGILLIDSGGQYYGKNSYGTTDITRTISIGTPTNEQKYNFTLVLKGHIAIATAVFKKGTTGSHLDILARQFLWENGLDYGHGTGHGVGCFLSVHEGNCNISLKSNIAIERGMILSNEPGFYKENEYGIRIENLILVKRSKYEDFLEFETITKVPIDEDLIDFKIVTADEKKWIKNYNKECLIL